jgi:uncharacterized alpha-E superfamily protein
MTSLSKFPLKKKRGRPAGSKNKPAAVVKSFKQLNNEAEKVRVQMMSERIDELENIRTHLHRVIDNLEHQAVQYRAVIDYLETKLEIK